MAVVVVAFDGSFLDCPVHSLDLAVCPRMLDLCQPVLDAILLAAHVEHVRHISGCWSIGVAGREGELNAVVGEHGVDFVGNGLNQIHQERGCRIPISLRDQLDEGKLARSINANIKIKPAFRRLHLGYVDVKIADRIGLELFSIRLVAIHFRQPRDAMSL